MYQWNQQSWVEQHISDMCPTSGGEPEPWPLTTWFISEGCTTMPVSGLLFADVACIKKHGIMHERITQIPVYYTPKLNSCYAFVRKSFPVV